MTIILYDTPQTHAAFYPLTLTKPVAWLRQGIFTIAEWWQRTTGQQVASLGEDYLNLPTTPKDEIYLYIDASLQPQPGQVETLQTLKINEGLVHKGRLVAAKVAQPLVYPVQQNLLADLQLQEIAEAKFIQFPWQLFQTNTQAIATHYRLITEGRTAPMIDATNVITGGEDIFIEPGAVVKGCFLNASEGPIYIGKDALVMEGTAVRGPVAIGEKAVVKMGARLYGGATIGPHCTAGGEIKNAILSAYSNKAHDGYLGDAVIGEWCNLGAGTTNSNVKNTAGEVKLWSQTAQDYVPVGKKAGLLMGDYSRSAINTGFNTGTVVGTCCNVFGNHQPPKHVTSFTWGQEQYRFDKVLMDVSNWKAFKGQLLEEREKQMLNELYRSTLPADEI